MYIEVVLPLLFVISFASLALLVYMMYIIYYYVETYGQIPSEHINTLRILDLVKNGAHFIH